jgi:hypothetical protein
MVPFGEKAATIRSEGVLHVSSRAKLRFSFSAASTIYPPHAHKHRVSPRAAPMSGPELTGFTK